MVNVALRGAQAGVPKGALYDANVDLFIRQAGCEGVAQPVGMHPFRNVGLAAESLEQIADVGRQQRLPTQGREHGASNAHSRFPFKPSL